jgi:hypothetical protein
MSIQNNKPLQVLRPAIWPDDKNVFYWIFAVEVASLLAGAILHNQIMVFLSLVFTAILPGIPLFFHTAFHLLAKVEIFDDRFVLTSYIGNNLIKLEKKQELFFREIGYVYYLKREIEFLEAFCSHFKRLKDIKTESDFTFDSISKKYKITREEYDECLRKIKNLPSDINSDGVSAFLQTKLNLKKYIWTETRAKGFIATARTKACLVLSAKEGGKVYFANFYDLSGTDSQGFLRLLKEKNPKINFLMNPRQVKRLFSF